MMIFFFALPVVFIYIECVKYAKPNLIRECVYEYIASFGIGEILKFP